MTETKKRSLSWGVGIWLLYGGFVLFILACVGFASMQHFDLVEDQYYERGVQYQQQIDKTARTAALIDQPDFRFDAAAHSFFVSFPSAYLSSAISGTLTLYRPSNSSYDRTVPLQLDSAGRACVPMQNLPAGYWKVKLDWRYGDAAYYNEHSFVIE